MANHWRNISTAARNSLNARILALKNRLRAIPAAQSEQIFDTKNELAPLLMQQKLGSDIPLGLFISKLWLNEAINGLNAPIPSNSNADAWDFLVCKMGLDDSVSPPVLRPLLYFYTGTNVPSGVPVETIQINGGPGGGGGVVASSTPPPSS